MKRSKIIYTVVLILVAGISWTFVAGQSNEFQRMDISPRRLRPTLPPVASPSSINMSTTLPAYQPQEDSQAPNTTGVGPTENGSSMIQPGQVVPNGQQMRQVSHIAGEGDENVNRQALLVQGQRNGGATINPLARNNSTKTETEKNVPVSATIQQSPASTSVVIDPATENQHVGTMSVVGTGNWGSQDDVPEHVFQGISQMQETAQSTRPAQPPMLPPLSENGVTSSGQFNQSPIMPPMLLDQTPDESRDALSLTLDENSRLPNNSQNWYQDNIPGTAFDGESDGLIPIPPLQPGQMPQVDAIGNPGHPFADNPIATEPQGHGNIRMSLGNLQPVQEQMEVPNSIDQAFSAEPQAEMAIPEERITRNDSVQNMMPIDIRNDGTTLQLGNQWNEHNGTPSDQEGTGLPGARELAGAQSPNLVIEKIMPLEVQINEPITVVISIRNRGSSKAKNVVLTDRLPKGARFVDANASGTRTANGEICWQLGDLGINEERNVKLTLTPTVEGEIGSVATATFSVEASGSTQVTKPALTMEVTTVNNEHLVGGDLILEILLSNPGTGAARNITLEEYVPDGLSHPTGKKLSSASGDLKPNESKRMRLTLKCERAGEMINYIVAKGENDLFVENKTPILVLAPGLTLSMDGPKNRYLDRKATYDLQIGNPGTATTREVLLFAKLPKGLDFVSTDSMGAYDPETHTVHWMLDALPAQQSGKIELVTLPRTIGEYKIEFFGRAQGNLQASASHEVVVDGIASLGFEVTNKIDPVELGREAAYEIRIFNRGTKASSNISIRVQLPEDMRFIAAEGPTQHNISGAIIDFVNLHQLVPGEVKTYLIRAQCLAVGDQRVLVQVQSDEMEKPVTKEENTNVYGDE